MPTATLEDLAHQTVTTKEELEELRRRLHEQRRNDTRSPIPGDPDPNREPGWHDNLDALIYFLEDLREIMRFTITQRIPEDARDVFLQHFPTIEASINLAIQTLNLVESEEDPIFQRLIDADLTGTPGLLKFSQFWGGIGRRPLLAVLETGDRILKSLIPILAELEPVNEFKEMIEERIKHGGDAGLQSLNLNGREGWWRKTE